MIIIIITTTRIIVVIIAGCNRRYHMQDRVYDLRFTIMLHSTTHQKNYVFVWCINTVIIKTILLLFLINSLPDRVFFTS